MLKCLSKIFHCFNKIFHSRRIIIFTDTKTTQIKFSAILQILLLAILSTSISWFTIKFIKYKNYHNYALILAENDRLRQEHKQIRKDFKEYEKKFDKINEYLQVKEVKKAEKKDYQSLTNEQMASALQHKTLLAFAKINERKKHISNSVKKLGISNITYNKLIKTAKISPEDQNNMLNVLSNTLDEDHIGGLDAEVRKIETTKVVKTVPFIKIADGNVNEKNYEKEIDNIISVEKVLQTLPFGIPTKGKYHITSTYGFREDPVKKNGALRIHKGIDMVLHDNEIVAPKNGTVIFAGTKSGYGNCIDIEHPIKGIRSKVVTHYAHLKKINVEKGQKVQEGDLIGIQGNTGRSTGPHLHYEIQINGQAVNPYNFMRVDKI